MSKRTYEWFVRPANRETSESIAGFLEATESDQEEVEIKGDDGKTHRYPAYGCSFADLTYIRKSLKSSGLEADFWQRVNNGKYRKWDPEAIKRTSLRNKAEKKFRKMKKQGAFSFAKKDTSSDKEKG